MRINVEVVNQNLLIPPEDKYVVEGTQEFIEFHFNLRDGWENLVVFAQFIQENNAYNVYLDSDNNAFLPAEIESGLLQVVLYGTAGDVIAVSNNLRMRVERTPFVGDGQSTEITLSLYQQMVDEFASIRSTSEEQGRDMDELRSSLALKADGAYVEDGIAHFMSGDEELFTISVGSGGGGGGGSGNDAVLSVANTTGWISTTISDTEDCELSFTWSSIEHDYPTGDGQIIIRVNGIVKYQQTVSQGDVTVDVTYYLGSGTNVVRATFSDVYGNTKTIAFSISLVALSISATAFDQSNASAIYNSPVTFSYTPIGAVSKNVVFILDGVIIGTQEVTTSGRQQTFTIPVQSHGSHSFEVYFTAVINGTTVSSNHLFYDLIFVENEVLTPIISSPFNAIGATQYYTISIPYRVYTPLSATSEGETFHPSLSTLKTRLLA